MKHWRLNTLLVMAIVLAMGLCTQTAQASVLTLADLIAGGGPNGNGTITVGDKVFSNFSFSESTDPANNGGLTPTTAGGIDVIGLVPGPALDELEFQSSFSGSGSCSLSAPNSCSGDILIGYTVTAPSALIHDIQLGFNGTVVSPVASVSVTETADIHGTLDQVGNITVAVPNGSSSDEMVLTGGPYTSIDVQKDIQFKWQSGGNASISSINQIVSQVPEPASVLLLGSGVLSLGLWGWKRGREEPSA